MDDQHRKEAGACAEDAALKHLQQHKLRLNYWLALTGYTDPAVSGKFFLP